ncbi:MAG: cell division protein FtsZ [Anaerolineae bacterium]|nr:cell division protein FtsZ [Anaerolineae bacterium]
MTTMVPTKPIQRSTLNTRLPVLKIIGMGGGGSNAVNRMIELDLKGAEFITANTDLQALNQSLAPKKICLGPRTTRGLGAGGNPSTGELAAEESFPVLCDALRGSDMVFLTAGMGGGTGTGSIAVAARAARAVGAVTVAVVTMPFTFEVGRRQRNAREGIAKLAPHADTLITVPNDQLLKIAPANLPLDMAFRMADDVLRQGVQGISELITQPGLINVDFAHIRQVMQMGGGSMLSIGIGEGPNKALKAVEHALHHPLLESISIDDATAIVANFTGGSDMTFMEMMEAMSYLQEQTHGRAEIIPGVITDERMRDRTQVILIITGLGATPLETRPADPRQLPMNEQRSPSFAEPVRPSLRHFIPPTPQPEPAEAQHEMAAADLDIPAFMRRRMR